MIYGIAHLLVDASCAFLILGLLGFAPGMLFNIVLYNVLAFGLQVPFGLLLDKYQYQKPAAIAGILLVFTAFMITQMPLLTIILAGTGNAIFHTGGGQVALNIKYKKATIPGIFVAPGGIGLALGIYLSVSGIKFNPYIFPISLLITTTLITLIKLPPLSVIKENSGRYNFFLIIIFLIMISISIRSVIGLTIVFPWKNNLYLLILLTLSIAIGKALGGVFADRFGFMKTGLTGLIISMPLLAFGSANPYAGLAGIFAFNLTMPVTLVAISNILPGRAAFSFGLSTFALLIGALPSFTKYKTWFNNDWIIFSFILLSAIALYFGLNSLKKGE